MKRLDRRRIAITGAAQGIGKAIAEEFAAQGANLFLLDLLNEELQAVQDTLSEQYPTQSFESAPADISDRDSIKNAFADRGTFDGLVNNAGVNVFHKPLETSDAEWDRNLKVNVDGAWQCARQVLPSMQNAGYGVIVNIASTHALTIIPETFPYPVAKHALLGLTRALAIEFAPNGIRVNAIAPGYIETQKVTDWWDSAPNPESAREETLSLHPQGRIGTPAEIAKAALFMMSNDCPFMTGTCLTIDGGLSIRQHG